MIVSRMAALSVPDGETLEIVASGEIFFDRMTGWTGWGGFFLGVEMRVLESVRIRRARRASCRARRELCSGTTPC
jgi:hypothetical protein